MNLLDIFVDALVDILKLIPFIFITYLGMGVLEKKFASNTKNLISRGSFLGPTIGSLLGAVPQCGFSASASSLYSLKIITAGTLISIFLSTSDEMIPVMISGGVSLSLMLKIVLIKIISGMIIGLCVDLAIRISLHSSVERRTEEEIMHQVAFHEIGCSCGGNAIKYAINHTLKLIGFIFIITLVLNTCFEIIGEETLRNFLSASGIIGNIIAAIIGLIPNCSASVIITELYIEGIMSDGMMLSGLLVGSGIGILVLFKENRHMAKSFAILGITFVSGIAIGTIFDIIGISL